MIIIDLETLLKTTPLGLNLLRYQIKSANLYVQGNKQFALLMGMLQIIYKELCEWHHMQSRGRKQYVDQMFTCASGSQQFGSQRDFRDSELKLKPKHNTDI